MSCIHFLFGLLAFASMGFTSCKKESPDQMVELVNQQKDSASLAGFIVVNVSGFKSTKGVLNVALFNSSSTFNTEVAFRQITVKVNSSVMQARFDSIPPGTYAFALFHDENENRRIDKNGIGIPKEGFAFSNNAMGSFGPPAFSIAKFVLPEKSILTQSVRLKFY